jgi:hypothetical protein
VKQTESAPSNYRCSAAARWLPRTLAGTVVLAALLVTSRFGNAPGIVGSARLRMAIWIGAGLLALWLLRKGAELRLRVSLTGNSLVFDYGGKPSSLRIEEIETLRFAPPFSWRRSWVAATVLQDGRGRTFRLPVALVAGDCLVSAVVARSAREDLSSWVDALKILPRMQRGRMHQALGYTIAAGIALAAVFFYLR